MQLEAVRSVVARYGPLGVFAARFIPGLCSIAGPLAGAGHLRFLPFLLASALGAAGYVPLAVTAGYAVGYGVAASPGPLRQLVGEAGQIMLVGAGVWGVIWLLSRLGRRRSNHRTLARSPEATE